MVGESDAGVRQRVLEAITDGALTELDLEKLLAVLLEQVRELLGVDTVTVLLLDAESRHLVATAAAGLEDEVFHGVRVPVGSGFAGRVAARREPVTLEHVDPSTVINPLLWERGLRVMVGVPMVAGGELEGVMHMGSTRPRRFTELEVDALQLVAARLALAAHAHRARAERAAATMLQDSLLPARLPAMSGWQLAARYVPGAGNGVGGDWYDVFPLPGGRMGLVIGDVVGNGLTAAVVMGRLRSALRAYALEFPDPADVLAKLDRKASHFERHTMATVGYAIVDGTGRQVALSLGGHLPPVLAAPGRPAELLHLPVDPPVGQSLALRGRRTTRFEVPSGALLALFTDGLVERRDEPLDDRLDLLCATVTPASVAASAEAVCGKIMAAMVGHQPASDDVALLAARQVATDPAGHEPGPGV